MTGIRIGVSQPVFERAGVVLAETTSASVEKLQEWFERTIAWVGRVPGQQLANILVALLAPAAGIALVMGLWRVSTDIGWAGAFLISGGLFSHWQVWIALSAALKLVSSSLLAWSGRTAKVSAER
ncbi:MAG TPA: hypothetical protein VMB25_25675 [Bryobacteraceae bacterium]|nr:hypothetical protein [Bryobacteraceae bacterium]